MSDKSAQPTHERRLHDQVNLATPDGARLNPDAVGWSSAPLHRANLRGSWGRNKRWDYWAVLAGDLVVAATFADIDYLGIADVYWVDLATGSTGGAAGRAGTLRQFQAASQRGGCRGAP